MALRYQASSGAGEVVRPKPRQLPPLEATGCLPALEAPAASSSTTTTTSLQTASCGRASPEAAEAGRGPLIPLVPGAPDAESVSGPLIPRAPEGPKTIGARPVPGRTSTVSLEPEDAPCAVVEARPTGPPRRSNSKSPRAFAETDPARFYCDLLYHQAEQQELWKQLDCSEDDADEMRIKRVDSSNFAVRRLEGHDAAGSRIFDPQALQRAHSYARAESYSRALSVDSGIFSEPDSDENDVDALPMVPTNSKHNHLQRRSSAFILDIIPKRLSNAQLDLQTADGEEEPGTGDEPLGDAPGATSQSRKNSVSSRVGSRVGSITLPVEIPHPMRGLLTAKKVNLGELRRLLQGLEDLGRWMEAPLDALGDPYVPKPLVVAVAETNSSLVELLIEFQADFAAPFDGPSMYKGWVKPGLQLVESVSNRKGRFVGTMLADKLEKIEGIFVEAVRVADERARKEKVGDDSAADEHSQEHSTTIPVTSRSQDSKRHTIGHPREHYEIEDHLGDGDTSKVFRGWHMESKIEVAIKGEAKSDEGGIFDEINMMRTFRHPNIARLYETFETESQVFIVLELCAGGSLFDAVGIDLSVEEVEVEVDLDAPEEPEDEEVLALGVTSLSPQASERDLGQLFEQAILDFNLHREGSSRAGARAAVDRDTNDKVHISVDRETGQSRGHAYVVDVKIGPTEEAAVCTSLARNGRAPLVESAKAKLKCHPHSHAADLRPEDFGMRSYQRVDTVLNLPLTIAGVHFQGWPEPSGCKTYTLRERKSANRGVEVVVVHGHGSSALRAEGGCSPLHMAVKPLLCAGFNVLAIDLRNHGHSSDGQPVSLGWHESLDVLAASDWLAARNVSRSRIFLWGESMGAATVGYAAAQDPRILAVAMEAPPVSMGMVLKSWASTALPLPLWFVSWLAWWAAFVYIDSPMAHDLLREGRFIKAEVFHSHAWEDQVVPFNNALALKAALLRRGEALGYESFFHTGGHVSSWEVPEEYYPRMLGFFSRIAAREASSVGKLQPGLSEPHVLEGSVAKTDERDGL
ncbi:unnamed protein product [Polarella glacialis]|uniref:Protein kinase domain-containing protein n=1 Tax=Polarella glacialis TaxID=89957 RepID=A0A813DBX3_POLGL|nr:unnamed protein product [Polarella glacialis]